MMIRGDWDLMARRICIIGISILILQIERSVLGGSSMVLDWDTVKYVVDEESDSTRDPIYFIRLPKG